MKLNDFNKTVSSKDVTTMISSKFGKDFGAVLDTMSESELKELRASVVAEQQGLAQKQGFNVTIKSPRYAAQNNFIKAIDLKLEENSMIPSVEDVGQEPMSPVVDANHAVEAPLPMASTGELASALKYLDSALKAVRSLSPKLAGLSHAQLHKMTEALRKFKHILEINHMPEPAIGMVESAKAKKAALKEDETSKAEVILAARDMVDRAQGMVEDLSKMKVEDLVGLTEKVRTSIDAGTASTFSTSVGNALDSAIQAMQTARQEMDNAALALTGEGDASAPVADTENKEADLDADLGDLGGDDLGGDLDTGLDGLAPASGGTEEVGRTRRESREFKKKPLKLESVNIDSMMVTLAGRKK